MKKSVILLSALLMMSVGCMAQKANAGSLGKDYQQVEKRFQESASDVEALAQDAQFMASLKKVVSKGDLASAQVVADHSTFVFMNGLLNEVGQGVSKMSETTKQTEAGKQMENLYNSIHIVDVGSKVPDFDLPTPDGKTINFYSFLKGKKCVILDFWASWCVWCRKENPTVKAAYDAYKDKGCDVISVSVDTKEQAWRKALGEDKPTWTQVVDYRGTKDGLYKWYNLNGIPAIFLIDAEGHIVAKNMRGEKIEEAIKSFLKL